MRNPRENIEYIYNILEDVDFSISTDSRQIKKGTVFFGVPGTQVNGGTFALEVLAKGARLAVVDKTVALVSPNIIQVEDVLETMKALAIKRREAITTPVVAIGGSSGKTTTKELTVAVLAQKYKAHGTEKNQNNELGLCMTLLSVPTNTEIVVLEIGANHLGEHTLLIDIAKPTHLLVTNIGIDHIGEYGGKEGPRISTKELFTYAEHANIPTFVNEEDLILTEDSKNTKQIKYPVVAATTNPDLTISFTLEGNTYPTKLFGLYNRYNIASAYVLGNYFDVPEEKIIHAIREYVPHNNRSEVCVDEYGNKIILDCYNANPSSMRESLLTAIEVVQEPYVYVIGDMMELGEHEEEYHRDIAHLLIEHSISPIIFVGTRFKKVMENELAQAGWYFVEKYTEVREMILPYQEKKGTTFFVKGSHSLSLEKIFDLK